MNHKEMALRHLAGRSRSVREMTVYLKRKGLSSQETSEIVGQLISEGLLNDVAYGIEYIRYGLAKNKAKRRIKMELVDKGLSSEHFQTAWEILVEEGDLGLADPFWEKKKAEELAWVGLSQVPITEKNLRKVAGKLKTLGYDSDTIYRTIGKWMDKTTEEG